ncbi:MAG TPA: ABC transporter substrate-binding protein/permease [Pirellulales bacterium]|nr:ABC transporter substrate-binding protein/permease [Pirellulales bacterium]
MQTRPLESPFRAALLAIVFLAGAAGAAEPDRQHLRRRLAEGTLRWGGDAEGGAPFQLRDPLDPRRVIGFEVELADALAENLGRRIGQPLRAEFVQYEWVSLPLGLDKADFDVILSGYEITPETRKAVLFSRPYYIYAEQLVVRGDERRIANLDDCRGKLVGTMAGSAAYRLLLQTGIEPVAFDGQVEPYLDLELGRLDAVLLDTPIVTYYAETNPKFKLVGGRIAPGEYGIAARSDDRELIAAINQSLRDLMVSGRLGQILQRWHLWNVDQAELARGASRDGELRGLGFDAAGHPIEKEPAVVDAVDRHIVAASAQQWTFSQYAPLLLRAAGTTVLLTVTSMLLAMLLGLVVAVARLYGPAPLRWWALSYVEFFRGLPLLLVLFFLYFGATPYLAELGFNLHAEAVAILGFGLNYAAYESEIYRSAILSVPRRQWEAGRALGMSDPLIFRRVIFPQAIRTALGPMTNDFVALFKDTSLVSVIAVRELTKEYLILSRSSLKFVELGVLTAVLYLAMSVPLGYLSRYLERRWGEESRR